MWLLSLALKDLLTLLTIAQLRPTQDYLHNPSTLPWDRKTSEMKRKSLEGSACAIARTLDVVGNRWSLLIIRETIAGTTRFSDLHRQLGVAKNILTVRLRALVEDGLLETAPASDGSAFQEYLISSKGRALLPALVALAQWGEEFLFEPGEPQLVPVDAKGGRSLKKLRIQSQDGRSLRLDEVLLRIVR
jgi:DNA-binding HxlR family transcriptional regulator